MNTMVIIKSLYFATFIVLFAFPAFSQTITMTQNFSFGTIAIRNINDNVGLVIQDNGNCNPNANTYEIVPCTRAEFLLTGGPANSVYTVTTPVSVTLNGSGPASFVMDNFRVRPNILRTNISGTDVFTIAADITSTSGDNFGDGLYSDTFNITVNF